MGGNGNRCVNVIRFHSCAFCSNWMMRKTIFPSFPREKIIESRTAFGAAIKTTRHRDHRVNFSIGQPFAFSTLLTLQHLVAPDEAYALD